MKTTALRKSVATACLLAVLAAAPGLAFADGIHTFTGFITDPAGKPSEGFRVVLVDMQNGKEFKSPPTNATGLYALGVPSGTRYTLVRVEAPDGTAMDVAELPPSDALVPGVTTLSVRFRRKTEAGAAPAPATAAPKAEAVPWWKKPAGIIGIIAGVGVVAAIAASGGGDDEPSASPSTP